MKYFFLMLILLCLPTIVSAQNDDLKWHTDFNKAKKISEKTNKPILMYFTGSDWCPPCKMLKSDFFSTEKFKQRSKDLVLLEVDIPRRTDVISEKQRLVNKELLKTYNKNGSFPTIVAVNSKGTVLSSIKAYSSLRDPSRHFDFVDSLINSAL